MKYLKYLTLSLFACMIMSSCEKQGVEFNWTTPTEAQIQLWYFTPTGSTINYALIGDLTDVSLDKDGLYENPSRSVFQDFSNNHGTFLAKNNFIPSGSTGLFYQVTAGKVDIALGTEKLTTAEVEEVEDSTYYVRTEIYRQSVNLENNKQYQLLIYDLEKAPKVIEHVTPPMWSETDSLGDGNHAAIKLINLMFEDATTTTEGKYIQAWLKKRDANGVVAETPFYKSKPVAFGDVSEWMEVELVKSSLIEQGSERVYVDLHEVTADGQDLGLLKYYNKKGQEKLFENDYWTTYYGRATYWVVCGTRDASQSEVAISLFYAR